MDEVDARGREGDRARTRACASCSPRRAAASSARSTRARPTCASRRTRSAPSRSRASGSGLASGDPLGGLPRQLHPARRDAGGAAPAGPDPRPAHLGAQRARRSTSAAAASTSTSPSAGPDLDDAGATTPRPCGTARASSAASPTPTPRSSSTSPSCASRSTATRAADLGVDTERHRDGAAPHGRRRRGRLALPRSDRERGLRRAAAARGGRPQRPGDDLAALRARARTAGSCGSTTSCSSCPRDGGVAHRPPRPPARGRGCAPRSRPASRLADRLEALRERGRRR